MALRSPDVICQTRAPVARGAAVTAVVSRSTGPGSSDKARSLSLSLLADSRHLGLCPLQPVRHLHLAEHRRRGGQVLLRLMLLAGASVELAKPEVAVSDEGAHATRLGEGQRLAVVGLAAFGIEPVGVGRNVTEQVERMGRVPGLTRGGAHRAVTQALRVVETAEHQRGSTQRLIEPSEKADVSSRGLTLEKVLTFPQPAQ